ncbi:TPA: DUF167 domain-containing protein [Candidatus Micrarchaeota archaeon]|nr:DUF167 domain-containing protein [Candidatus Micrarchaeota archaeon]
MELKGNTFMFAEVKVVLNARDPRIVEGPATGKIIAYLTEPPRKNKANIQLIKLLKEHYGMDREIRLVKGANSRKKIVEIV